MGASDVIVVGAGPAGTSTAHALARVGARVLLLDRARFPRPKPCAEFLSPQCARILEDMGALDALERAGAARLGGMVVRAPNGALIRGRYVAQRGHVPERPYGLSVRREVLDALLVERARDAGVDVREEMHVVGLERDADGRVRGVRVRARHGGEASARAALVVGADGLHSVVARRLGLARTARWPRRIALVTHYRGVAGIGTEGEMHVERDGFVGIADVGEGTTTVALVVPGVRGPELARDRAAFLDRWLAAHPQLAPRFADAVSVSPVRAVGPFASHARRAWASGAALVGDAADFFDPFTGQGIHAALRGGELLAGHAAAALAAPDESTADAALARYDAARRAEFAGKWRLERIIGAVVGFAPAMNRAARALASRADLADLLVGATGDYVPARELLRASVVAQVFLLPAPLRTRPSAPA